MENNEVIVMDTVEKTEENVVETSADSVKEKKNVKKKLPLVSLAIGIVIIIMGTMIALKGPKSGSHNTEDAYIGSYSFGADYYTESYNAAYQTVQKLNSIDKGIGTTTYNLEKIEGCIYIVSGMMIIAMGLATCAISLCFLKNE